MLFEREKREREDVLMKAASLLPDTYIIADLCGRVMDKVRIFCEGIVNDILENACIFEREKQPATCRIGSKGDPIPHWRAEKCFFPVHMSPEKTDCNLFSRR